MRLIINILSLWWWCASVLLAQHPVYWSLTVDDGLPTNEIYDLYQDSKGYIWIGTDKGVCRYNGQEFKYYSNKDQKGQALSGIQESSDGRIWMNSFKNELFYVENDSLHYFEALNDSTISRVDFYYIDKDDRIWIADLNVIKYYDFKSAQWVTVPRNKNRNLVRQIYQDKNKKVHLVSDSNIEHLTKDSFIAIPIDTIFYHSRPNIAKHGEQKIISYTLDLISSGDELFIGQKDPLKGFVEYKDRYLYNLQGYRKKYEHLIQKESFGANYRALSNGDVWCMTLGNGAYCLFNVDSTKNNHAGMHIFSGEAISDIVIDFEGNYWVSTINSGIHVIPSLALNCYNKENSFLKEDKLGLIHHQDSTLFIGNNDGGLYQYDYQTQSLLNYNKVPAGKLYSINQLGDNQLIVLAQKSVSTLKRDKDNKYKVSSSIYDQSREWNTKQIALYKDSLLVMALGWLNIVFSSPHWLKSGQKTMQDSTWFPIPGTPIFSRPHRTVHIGYRVNTFVLDEEHSRILTPLSDTLYVLLEQDDRIYPILNDQQETILASNLLKTTDGKIWVASLNDGLYCLDQDLKVEKHLTTKDGLIRNLIKKMVEGSDGKGIWLLCDKGVQYWDIAEGKGAIYNLEDGLPTLEILDILIADGKVWLTTSKGLVSFNEAMSSKNTSAPYVYINAVEIDYQNVNLKNHYDLDYTQNSIAIEVEIISYRSKSNLRYAYRMIGADSIWRSQEAISNTMRFPLLSTGNYTFEVKAVNSDGVESDVIQRIYFCINPPYWQTWWFQGGIYLIILLIIVGFIIRRNQINQQEQERKNAFNVLKMQALQSQMNPHFVFNVLTAIQNLWMQKKNEPALQMQSTFAKLLRKIFQYSSRKSITIEEEEEFLNNYLNLEQIRFEQSVQIDFSIAEELLDDDYSIPPLLIQPIIENSFKHGLFHKKTAKHLKIVLQKQDVYLYCLVEDNGVGRGFIKNQAKKERQTSGLTTTKDRLLILQDNEIGTIHPANNFKITDLKDREGNVLGTRVELWIPFVESE